MGHTSSIVTGLAGLLAGAGLGVYRPDGVYADNEVGIFLHRMPESPDKAYAITPYPVEDTGLTDVTDGLQIRMRAGPDPTEVLDMADAVRDLLHMRENTLVGGVRLSLIWRDSQAPMGQDPHGREELTSNYYARSCRPGAHVNE
ncbi:minor capsid protein [Streptomyces sp. NPDC060001]|uniref:minor capsid protein n=1 Tax=Streptomyces sp. NPDC060001 TaxID=3347032 RepID=UPI0036CE6867